MRVVYLGNFSVPFSTESHVAASLESLGHGVTRIQEGETPAYVVGGMLPVRTADMFLWTQTYGLAESGGTRAERAAMVKRIGDYGVPTVAFHLDRWWGLDREHQVTEEPFFRCDHVFTADGGHDEKWKFLDINHHWLSPGVFHEEAYDGTPTPRYTCDIVFVGSWRHYGHEEWWPTRKAMLDKLRRRYGRRFKMFPARQAVRGKDLTNLYASCKVAVGDSCLAGNPSRYWSDRVPETTGRGAALVHPSVEGLADEHPYAVTFPSGDWNEMCACLDELLEDAEGRELTRQLQADWTRNHHTYRHKMEAVIKEVFG